MNKQKNRYEFIALFNYADDGISIEFPDLPGCFSCAENQEEAFSNAKEALGLHIWGMEQDNEIIPEPSSLQKIVFEKSCVPAFIEIYMSSVRERMDNKSVNKTITLPLWLARTGEEQGMNFSKLLQSAICQKLDLKDERCNRIL